jgi:hypothetical protein
MKSGYRVERSVQDRQQIAAMLGKGRESARVLRRAMRLCQLDRGEKIVEVAPTSGYPARQCEPSAGATGKKDWSRLCTRSRGGGKSWCIAELDDEYIARMKDMLALCEKPLSEEEPVVCVDEKPAVLHADVRPPRPMRPGRVLRRDSECKREDAANVFCGVESKAGRHFTRATRNRCSPRFADYLVEIASHYPRGGPSIW